MENPYRPGFNEPPKELAGREAGRTVDILRDERGTCKDARSGRHRSVSRPGGVGQLLIRPSSSFFQLLVVALMSFA